MKMKRNPIKEEINILPWNMVGLITFGNYFTYVINQASQTLNIMNVFKINGYYQFIFKDDCGKFLMAKLIECHVSMVNWKPPEIAKWDRGMNNLTWKPLNPI